MSQRVQDYFETYPNSQECFETSDGFLFHQDYDAKAHARNLKDKSFSRIERGKEDESTELQSEIDTGSVTEPLTTDPSAPLVEIQRQDANDQAKGEAAKKSRVKKSDAPTDPI